MHWLDHLSLRLLRRSSVFADGWGEFTQFEALGDALKTPHAAPTLDFTWSPAKRERGLLVQDGTARSPSTVLPDARERCT
jgi:hypothetical protein